MEQEARRLDGRNADNVIQPPLQAPPARVVTDNTVNAYALTLDSVALLACSKRRLVVIQAIGEADAQIAELVELHQRPSLPGESVTSSTMLMHTLNLDLPLLLAKPWRGR